MLSIKGLVYDLSDVPKPWAFEYYLKLKEKLRGQRVMVTSPFNVNDYIPSFSVLPAGSHGFYVFKDFSTGASGDSLDFVKQLFNLDSRAAAATKVIEDYREWSKNNKYEHVEFKQHEPFKVTEFTKRGWNTNDQRFWTDFNINSALLERYNVSPLESYVMSKQEDDQIRTINIMDRGYMYGYFKLDGTLYKIYQPYVKDMKFLKVTTYVQGTEQLTYQKKYLIIVSSLKDLMSLMTLGYNNIEAVAPDSENTMINPQIISSYKQKYKGICTLFDNDEPGMVATAKYHSNYEIPGVTLKLSKDLSDSIYDHGVPYTRQTLTPLLKQVLS